MKKLITLALLLVTASAVAATQRYYEYPETAQIKDSDRLLVFQNSSGSRNITGAMLKSAILASPTVTGTISVPNLKFSNVASSDVNTLDYYQEGAFIATFTGLDPVTTSQAYYIRVGKLITVSIQPGGIGTSNANTFSITGFPAEIQPTVTQYLTGVMVFDNGGDVVMSKGTLTGDTIMLMPNLTSPGNTWTPSGLKGMNDGWIFSYLK